LFRLRPAATLWSARIRPLCIAELFSCAVTATSYSAQHLQFCTLHFNVWRKSTEVHFPMYSANNRLGY